MKTWHVPIPCEGSNEKAWVFDRKESTGPAMKETGPRKRERHIRHEESAVLLLIKLSFVRKASAHGLNRGLEASGMVRRRSQICSRCILM